MRGRRDLGRRLDQFRLALDERCSMEVAALRIEQRATAARLEAAVANHKAAMRSLYAKGFGKGRKPHD